MSKQPMPPKCAFEIEYVAALENGRYKWRYYALTKNNQEIIACYNYIIADVNGKECP
jgi:hypothetical protein